MPIKISQASFMKTVWSVFLASTLYIGACLTPSLCLQAQEKATVEDVTQVNKYSLQLKVETTASRETIWQLWEDVENWKRYDELVIYSRLDPGHEFVKGAQGEVKAKGAPKSRFTLTEVSPGNSFTERLSTPLWQSINLHRYFETSDNGNTVFVHEVEFKGRLRWLIYAAAGATFKKELPRVMNKLRELAETLEDESNND